jgi:hypothetical protein
MNSSAMEFASIFLQRKNLNGSNLDVQTFNVFMALDGTRSLGDICREDKYEKNFLAEKIQLLLKMDLIEPGQKNGIKDSNFIESLLATICKQGNGLDGYADANKQINVTAKQHESHQPGRGQINMAGVVSSTLAANIVFETMMLHIFDIIKQKDAQHFNSLCDELTETVNALQIQNSNAVEILKWLNRPSNPISTELPIQLLREVITCTYALVCEYYGPVLADQALQSAAKVTNAIPEAQEISPNQLL